MGLNWFTGAVGGAAIILSGLVGAVVSRRVMMTYVRDTAVAPGLIRSGSLGGGGGGASSLDVTRDADEDDERGEDWSVRGGARTGSSAGGSWTGRFGGGFSPISPSGSSFTLFGGGGRTGSDGGTPKEPGVAAPLTAAAMAAKEEGEALLARRAAAATAESEDTFLREWWWWDEAHSAPPPPAEPPAPTFPNNFAREMDDLERRHFAQVMCDQHDILTAALGPS